MPGDELSYWISLGRNGHAYRGDGIGPGGGRRNAEDHRRGWGPDQGKSERPPISRPPSGFLRDDRLDPSRPMRARPSVLPTPSASGQSQRHPPQALRRTPTCAAGCEMPNVKTLPCAYRSGTRARETLHPMPDAPSTCNPRVACSASLPRRGAAKIVRPRLSEPSRVKGRKTWSTAPPRPTS
jgi:hypothetical protein